MPAKSRDNNTPLDSGIVEALDKIARVLGLLVVKDLEDKTAQVVMLRSAGFDVADIAAMLRMTENHVRVASHLGRKTKLKKKSAKAR